ncbi:MAG: CpaF/VirB11 family protein [Oscillospiraceae bacterium]|nr:CpaF/VirB11 family protein [Oscillospiraceae bacterium]
MKYDFWGLLALAQEHITAHYAAALSDTEKDGQLKSYIRKYLRDVDKHMDKSTLEDLTGRLYREMAEYSILTPYLGSPLLEEINVNSWNDIALTYTDGRIEKLDEHFHSPGHATDIVKRLLHNSGMIIDNSTPISQGHLPNNTRITAIKEPIIDEGQGIAVSIRLLHPQRVTREMLLESGSATEEMLDFLAMCVRYGVSVVSAGATSSGKTTLLNCLLTDIPDNKRIFTIESGSRELSLVREAEGRVSNNVVHTLSRPSDNEAYDISQEKLVISSLRFNPDIVVVGEMRDVECYSAVEASLTGHTVVSSVHAGDCARTHLRIALLCQKKFPIDFSTSLIQAAQAFPIVVFCHKLEDNSRKLMEIAEAEITPGGERRYRTLYRYKITKNTYHNGKFSMEGNFEKPESISGGLKQKLMQYGVPQDILRKFTMGTEAMCK